MPQLWGGRFVKGTDALAEEFNASILFDKRLVLQDIAGSIAHAKMLKKQEIIDIEDADRIIQGLEAMLREFEYGLLEVDDSYEDIHSYVEATLIHRIGDAGKKLHTARSRNDQVATDMKMYIRDEIKNIDVLLYELLSSFVTTMEEQIDTYIPGFTHLQKAQPTTLAHHIGAYFEMFRRDRERLDDVLIRLNFCPLGSGALAGTIYNIDREYTAELLNFDGPTRNSMDSVSDRDYLIEFLSTLSIIMMHLSRFCEDFIIWNSNEYGFVELDDAYSTGSSIMPQKKNPDIAELVRGKTGRVYGALTAILTTMKGLSLAYNKDMQEDKEFVFDAIDTVSSCLLLFRKMFETTTWITTRMEESAKLGFTNATDVADYLVQKGVAFRDAHKIVGDMVLYCIEERISLEDMKLEEMKELSSYIEEDIFDKISLFSCVNSRKSYGGPSKEAMEVAIQNYKEYLSR